MTQQNIHTLQDILDALENNPDLQREFHKHLVSAVRSDSELREELRKEILTEELLQLPARFTRLEETVEEIKQDVTELKQDMVEVKDRFDHLEQGQERMSGQIAHLTQEQIRMSGELARLNGKDYQTRAVNQARRTIRHELNMEDSNLIHPNQEGIPAKFKKEILTPAKLAGRINQNQVEDLENADGIIQCENPDGQIIYAVVEMSITVQKHDRERAVRRAGIMEQATGIPTIPYVAGTKQDPPESGESPVRFLEYQWDQENRQD